MIRLESHHLNKVTHVHSSVAPFSVCPHAYLILCRYEYPTIKKVYLNKHGSLYKVAFIASPSYGHPFKMCMMWLHQAFNRNRAVGKCQKKPGTWVALSKNDQLPVLRRGAKDAKLPGPHPVCSPLYALCLAQLLASSKYLHINWGTNLEPDWTILFQDMEQNLRKQQLTCCFSLK